MSEGAMLITGIGMISSIGNNWEQSCSAHRAGINQFLEYEQFYPANEELDSGEQRPLIAARAPLVGKSMEELRGPKLVVPVLQEMISDANITREMFDSTVLLTTFSLNKGVEGEKKLFKAYKRELTKLSVNCTANRELVRAQHTGFAELLTAAKHKLETGECEACILLVVDSLNRIETLVALDESGRIKSKKNKNGFIPGEAAVAMLVETEAHAAARNANIRARVSAIAHTREKNTRASDKPSSGLGLSGAIRQVCAQAGGLKPEWTVCDLNGETFRAYEWGMARVKAHDVLAKLSVVWHPADCFGDVGAATGGVLVALVVKAFEKKYAVANQCLVWCSNDDEKRSAMVISNNNP